MQPSPRTLQALYKAMLSVASSPELGEAQRLWVHEFAIRLIAELTSLNSEEDAQPPEEIAPRTR